MSPTEDAFCVRLHSCLSCEAYCVCIACRMVVGCARRVLGNRYFFKVLMDGLKERNLIGMWEEAWYAACLGCRRLLSPNTHKRHSVICELVCVFVSSFNYKPTRPINDQTNKRKPECSPSLDWSPWLFLVYWFIIWSLLFSLWTSKPLGGALDNSSWCSACPPVSSLKDQDCQFNQPVRSFGCQRPYVDNITVME